MAVSLSQRFYNWVALRGVDIWPRGLVGGRELKQTTGGLSTVCIGNFGSVDRLEVAARSSGKVHSGLVSTSPPAVSLVSDGG